MRLAKTENSNINISVAGQSTVSAEDDVTGPSPPAPDDVMPWWWWVVLIIVAMVISMLIATCVICSCHNKKFCFAPKRGMEEM